MIIKKLKNKRFIKGLSKLTEIELKNFKRFLQSPYFNSSARIFEIFRYLEKFYPEFNDERALMAEEICHKIYPNIDYSSNLRKNLLNSLSDLNLLLENYLIINEVQKIPFRERKEFLSILFSEENRSDNFKQNKNSFNYNIDNIPEELITSLQQYFLFFREFVQTAKGEQINFNVLRNKNGLEFRLKLDDDTGLTIDKVREYLNEYIGLAVNQEEVDFEVKGEVNEEDVKLLKQRLERQIENLNWEVRLRDEKITLLSERIIDLKNEKDNLYNLISSAKSQKEERSKEEIKRTCKNFLRKNEFEEVFLLLKEVFENKNEKLNEVVAVESQWNMLVKEKNLGKISDEFYTIQNSRLVAGVLYLIDKIE